MSGEKSVQNKILDSIQPFVIGGFGGICATLCVQPIDMVKVRIQIEGEALKGKAKVSSLDMAKKIYEKGGIKSFYRGVDSAITRQIFYGTTRLGMYKWLYTNYKQNNNGKEPDMWIKSGYALQAGFIGSLVGNPADLALIRMQADLTMPKAERRNYGNVLNAFYRIVKEEGVTALWRGSTPTIIRALVINLAMLAPYDEVKLRMNQWRGNQDSNRLYAAAIAGFLSAFSALPFDNAKTKMQKMKPDAQGVMPYKNIGDALMKTISNEGVAGLWIGFSTFYVRIAPHVMISLVIIDYLTDLAKKYRGQKY